MADGPRGARFGEPRGLGGRPPQARRYGVNTAEPQQYISSSLSAQSEGVSLENPADTLTAGGAAGRSLIVSRPKSAGIKTLAAPNPTGGAGPDWGGLRPVVLPSDRERGG